MLTILKLNYRKVFWLTSLKINLLPNFTVKVTTNRVLRGVKGLFCPTLNWSLVIRITTYNQNKLIYSIYTFFSYSMATRSQNNKPMIITFLLADLGEECSGAKAPTVSRIYLYYFYLLFCRL